MKAGKSLEWGAWSTQWAGRKCCALVLERHSQHACNVEVNEAFVASSKRCFGRLPFGVIPPKHSLSITYTEHFFTSNNSEFVALGQCKSQVIFHKQKEEKKAFPKLWWHKFLWIAALTPANNGLESRMAVLSCPRKKKFIARVSAVASVLPVRFAVPSNVMMIKRQKKRANAQTRRREAICNQGWEASWAHYSDVICWRECTLISYCAEVKLNEHDARAVEELGLALGYSWRARSRLVKPGHCSW